MCFFASEGTTSKGVTSMGSWTPPQKGTTSIRSEGSDSACTCTGFGAGRVSAQSQSLQDTAQTTTRVCHKLYTSLSVCIFGPGTTSLFSGRVWHIDVALVASSSCTIAESYTIAETATPTVCSTISSCCGRRRSMPTDTPSSGVGGTVSATSRTSPSSGRGPTTSTTSGCWQTGVRDPKLWSRQLWPANEDSRTWPSSGRGAGATFGRFAAELSTKWHGSFALSL